MELERQVMEHEKLAGTADSDVDASQGDAPLVASQRRHSIANGMIPMLASAHINGEASAHVAPQLMLDGFTSVLVN